MRRGFYRGELALTRKIDYVTPRLAEPDHSQWGFSCFFQTPPHSPSRGRVITIAGRVLGDCQESLVFAPSLKGRAGGESAFTLHCLEGE